MYKNREVLYTVIAAIVMSVGIASAALTDGLQGYWQFNGNGSDRSGQDRDLTVTGSYGKSIFEQALNLTGSNDEYAVRSSDDDALDFGTSDFALQIWVNWNTTAGEQVIIEKFSGSDGPGWTLTKLSSNAIQFYLTSGSATSATLNITSGVWYQVVVSRSSSWLDIYFDGELVLQANVTSLTVPDTDLPLLIGKRNSVDGRDFATDGLVDETAIWSRPLSETEVTTLYNNGQGIMIPEPTTMVILGFGVLSLIRTKR